MTQFAFLAHEWPAVLDASSRAESAEEESHGLGVFVRSLIGMDREAAKAVLAGFIGDKALTANQIEFIDLVVEHLTDRGILLPAALYESPFTDVAPTGPRRDLPVRTG
jgi:type I restriction enzyme, R subunit